MLNQSINAESSKVFGKVGNLQKLAVTSLQERMGSLFRRQPEYLATGDSAALTSVPTMKGAIPT